MRRGVRVIAQLALALLAFVVLVRAGRGALASPPLGRPGDWPAWAATREPALAVVALIRLVGLAVAGYLVAVTSVVALATLRPSGPWPALVRALALPALRPLLATSLATVPPLTDAPPTTFAPTSSVVDRADGATMRLLDEERPPPAPPPAAPPAAPAPTSTTHTIVPGEHLWAVAEQALARAWGRPPTDGEIVPYWRALIEGNRNRLADPRNPDLVFPGQVMTLPPVPVASSSDRA